MALFLLHVPIFISKTSPNLIYFNSLFTLTSCLRRNTANSRHPLKVLHQKHSMATMTMAMLNAKCLSLNSPNHVNPPKQTIKPISLLSLQNLPTGLTSPKSSINSKAAPIVETAIAGAIFSSLSCCDSALAVQQIAELAANGDNRGLALLLPIIPAILWVLYNILPPALNQLNRMRESKGVIIGLGLGGLAASSFISTPAASAGEIAMIAAAVKDSRGTLLLFVIAPAILWVLYNILQPALNQLNRMRSE